jgi:hypothetical protein
MIRSNQEYGERPIIAIVGRMLSDSAIPLATRELMIPLA